jgi:hypothetical protein
MQATPALDSTTLVLAKSMGDERRHGIAIAADHAFTSVTTARLTI